jgi:hypothetical protein
MVTRRNSRLTLGCLQTNQCFAWSNSGFASSLSQPGVKSAVYGDGDNTRIETWVVQMAIMGALTRGIIRPLVASEVWPFLKGAPENSRRARVAPSA